MDLRLTRAAEGGKPRRKEGAGWPAARALGARARSPSGPMEVAWEGVLGVNGGVSPPKADNRAERPQRQRAGAGPGGRPATSPASQRRDAGAFLRAGGGGSRARPLPAAGPGRFRIAESEAAGC